MTDPDKRALFRLADEERDALLALYRDIMGGYSGDLELLAHVTDLADAYRAHVTDLADAYRAQGYVMGDLAHDGTLRAQAEAEEQ